MRFSHVSTLLLTLALSFTLTGCAGSSSKSTSEAAIPASPPNESESHLASLPLFVLEKKPFQKTITTPGELKPYEAVDIYPKIEGFIQSIYVDRGTRVHSGQLLASLVDPELEARIVEAKSKVKAADADDAEADAKYLSEQGYYNRLKEASQVPGVISANELTTAQMQAAAAKAHVVALKNAKQARLANVSSLSRVRNYLQIRSPINGVVTERNLHPGALVGPSGGGGEEPILKIEDLSHLRLLVSIPERYYGSVHVGALMPFTVPAYPDKIFTGRVSRPAYALDQKNRTETVELDVSNSGQALSPGMYAEVRWPVSRTATFMVPASAIVSTTERIFVERVRQGRLEWVDVHKGFSDKDKIEVFGDLSPGDFLVTNASDEYADGMPIASKTK